MTEPRAARFGPFLLGATHLWIVGSVVLLVEYLGVSLTFDAAEVARRGGAWVLAARLGALAPIGVAVATALMLFRGEPREAARVDGFPLGRRLFRLGVHAALYAGFIALTRHVFARDEAPVGPAVGWLSLWALLGVGAAVSLFAALVGVRLLLERVLSGWVLAAAALGAAAWVAGHLSSDVWQPLSFAAMLGAGGILRIVAPDVMVDLEQMHLGLGDFVVLVAPVCSGLEGMGLILVLLSGYLFVLRRHFHFPRALALVPIGIAAVWLGNAVRLAGLMLVGAYIDPDVALGGFHSKAGWVLFCGITLAVAALARRSSYFSRDVAAESGIENPTAPYVVPLLALVGTALVTAMFASAVDSVYGLRLVPAMILLYVYRRHYRGLVATPSVRSVLVGLLVGALWMATGPRGTVVPSEHPGAGWVVLRLVGSVLVAPLCEELAFRGFLLRRLVSRDFEEVSFRRWTPLAVAVSSLVFGLLHERWLAAALAGAVYALLQIRSGRLSDAVAAHAVTNAAVAAASLATGDWSSWS